MLSASVFVCSYSSFYFLSFFFFNDTATTEIYTLSLHDALPIWRRRDAAAAPHRQAAAQPAGADRVEGRSEEHTSELQSHSDLVCRLLLEKKKKKKKKKTKKKETNNTQKT